MKHVMKFGGLAAVLSMTSACGQHETLRSVSDFCLNDRRISIAPAPVAGADDPGNAFDSEQTVSEVLEHNAVTDRLCPKVGPKLDAGAPHSAKVGKPAG